MSGSCAWYGWQDYSTLKQWEYELARYRAAIAGVSAEKVDGEIGIGTELAIANKVIAHLNTPWADLFTALESVYSDETVLLSIEPDAELRQVRLTGESRTAEAMLDFVRQMRASRVLADAYVTSHTVNQQDNQHPVRFSVATHWFDPSPIPSEKTAGESASAQQLPASNVVVNQDKGTNLTAPVGETRL